MAMCCLIKAKVWWLGCLLASLFIVYFGLVLLFKCRKRSQSERKFSIAFFHPYCNAGGGGERVLWCAIRYLQKIYKGDISCYVYTGDTDTSGEKILEKAKLRFGVQLDLPVHFVFLNKRYLVEARLYPCFTLLGQSLGGFLLGFEALFKFVPDLYFDSMGYAFATPLFRYLARCQTASYVHYPTISTDMLQLVKERRENFNNKAHISRNPVLSAVKLIYYQFFAKLYGCAGRANDLILVNSTWTYNHIVEIWKKPAHTRIIHPPCDSKSFQNLESQAERLLREEKQIQLLSVGQFRPEKNYPLQLQFTKQIIDKIAETNYDVKIQLVIIGGCRDKSDEHRVEQLKQQAVDLGIDDHVIFKINATFDELKVEMQQSLIGIHTMHNEHFGIGVVECMAAGLITVANNSGGPSLDIIKSKDEVTSMESCGFLASTADEYTDTILNILDMPADNRNRIRQNARARCDRFSDDQFDLKFSDFCKNFICIP